MSRVHAHFGPARRRIRASARVLATLALLSLGTGCDGWLPETPSAPDPPAESAESADTPASDSPEARLAALRKRYKGSGQDRAEEDPGNPAIRCRVDGSVGYMRRNDCLVRGGAPL